MNKVDLIAQVAKETGHTKKDVGEILNGIIDVIAVNVAKGEEVSLYGFATFFPKELEERECINPKTQEKITAPAKRSIGVRLSKAFKNLINNSN